MAQQYLSFNENFGGKGSFGVPEEDDPAVIEALREPMKLRDNWVLWEQVVTEPSGKADVKFADALKEVCEFNTVQEFWSIWNAIPQPSELLDQRRITRETGNVSQPIDAIMIFKKGIRPEWEHPINEKGGHFQISLKTSVGGGQIDEYWNNVVLAMIGGTLDPADMITGVRLVDKLSGPKIAQSVRIELWFARYSDSSSVNALKRSFEKCLATRVDGSSNPGAVKADTKAHGNISKH